MNQNPIADVRLMMKSLGSAAGLWAAVPRRALLLWLVMACCLFVSMGASAAEAGWLDGILRNYDGLKRTWYTLIKDYARNLFWLLVLVDVGWSAVIYALEKEDVGDIVKSLTKKIFTIGFFWALLHFSDTWIPAIIDSFTQIGKTVGNVPEGATSPDGIVMQGIRIAENAFAALHKMGIAETIAAVVPVAIVALLIFMCFLFVALTLMITLLESYLVIGAGVILLGFGGSRWTTDFATKYLQHAVGTGLKLMLIYLLIGAAGTLFVDAKIDPNQLFRSMFVLLGSAATYAFFIVKVPAIASGMLSGSPALSTGDAMGTALAVGAAMAGVGAAGMAMGNAAAGGAGNVAAGATGLAKALGAGASSGLDMGKSGMGLGVHAVGEVAKHGLGLGASAIGSAVNHATTAFAEKVEDSTGGRIASSIEATRGGDLTGVGAPAPSGGAESAGAAAAGAPLSSGGAAPQGAASSGGATGGSAPASGAASNARPPGAAARSAAGSGATFSPSTGAGDATTASLSGATSGPSAEPPARRNPLADRIQSLQGYVPQDMAQVSSPQISAQHTQD